MTKKISILILTLAATLTAAAHHYEAANADSVTIYYTDVTAGYGKNAVEVTYRGTWYGAYPDTYKDTVNIPNEIVVEGTKYKVIGIGEQAFSQSFNLKSVTIPESIEYIRDKAFENCYNIAEVNYNAVRCADFTLPEFAPFSPFAALISRCRSLLRSLSETWHIANMYIRKMTIVILINSGLHTNCVPSISAPV